MPKLGVYQALAWLSITSFSEIGKISLIQKILESYENQLKMEPARAEIHFLLHKLMK